MRWSQFFAPTLRDVPADAEVVSHQLLLRAGFIRQLAAGVYSYLPLAKRTLAKIEKIVREEMNRIGAQEFYLPALNPAEIWKATGRWDALHDVMFQFKDRTGRDVCLGVTHEEVFTTIARDELRSYRDLPQIWYQIQLKFRDEPRPKSGLLRVRQFTMKDSYSFDLDAKGLDHSYLLHREAYRRTFDRCGLKYLIVQAESGAMGGSESEEFVVLSEAGEDWIAKCPQGDYSANLERARSGLRDQEPDADSLPVETAHTPGQKTIQQVSSFLEIPQGRQIKSLVYIVQDNPYLVLVRGDHQLSEAKLGRALGTDLLRPARTDEIKGLLGADPGSLGPVGVTALKLIADDALKGRRNLVCGANRDDYHLVNVTPGRDFETEYADLRQVQSGEPCPDCGHPLEVVKAIEIGHIFKLGYKYSQALGASVLDQQGRESPIIMGSYGIGIDRLMASAVELFHDSSGILWPRAISPFEVTVVLVRPDDSVQKQFAEELYENLVAEGIDCLLDDRDERPGVKFKDTELIGIPIRVTIGNKLRDGEVEIFSRFSKEMATVPSDTTLAETLKALQSYPL